jgi:hypothetical protein
MKTREERSIWKLDSSEQRQLVIAFVGGLGSIIVGACVLGIAAVLARDEERGQGFTLIGLLGYTSTLGTLIIVTLGGLRSERHLFRRISQIALIVLALLLTLMVLVWIGIAAGLH